MAYPPQLPPTTRTDATISAGNHATDHNKIAAALEDLLEELGAGPSGNYANLTERLLDVAAGVALTGAGIDTTGATPSTAAIQAKLTAAAAFGAPVYGQPDAVYLLDAALTIPHGLRWHGRGATLRASAGIGHRLLTAQGSLNNVLIEGLDLDLNLANVTAPASPYTSETAGILLTGTILDVTLRNITIRDGHQYGIYAIRSTGTDLELTLDNVTVTGCRIGTLIDNGTNVRVQGGRYDTNRQDGLYFDQGAGHRVSGVQANSNGRHGIVFDRAAHDFTVTGCVTNYNGLDGDVGEGIGIVTSVNVNHFTITGNVCVGNLTSGIQIDTNNGTSTQVDTYGTVTGNLCADSVEFHGIYVTYARFVTVTGNVCAGNNHSGILLACSESVVIGNELVGNTQAGLYLGYGAGLTPNMGDHVIGLNLYRDNGTNIVTSGGGALTRSRFLDARQGIDLDDGQVLRFGSDPATQAKLVRNGSKRLHLSDSSVLMDLGHSIELIGASGNTALIKMLSSTLRFRGGAAGVEFINNGDSKALLTILNSGGVQLANVDSVPATPTAAGVFYVEGGALKYKGSSGTVTTIAPA